LKCVKHIHDKGIIHGDINPSNLIEINGDLKIIDFDSSCYIYNNDVNSTNDCYVLNNNKPYSSTYLPPEAVYIDKNVNIATIKIGTNLNKIKSNTSISPSTSNNDCNSNILTENIVNNSNISIYNSNKVNNYCDIDANIIEDDEDDEFGFSDDVIQDISKNNNKYNNNYQQNLDCSLLQACPSFDIWSIGCIMYQLCNINGRSLFDGGITNHLNEYNDNSCDNLFMLCNWKDDLKKSKLNHIQDTKARSLLNLILHKDPLKRPSISRILSDPFLTQEIDTPEIIMATNCINNIINNVKISIKNNIPVNNKTIIDSIDASNKSKFKSKFNLKLLQNDIKFQLHQHQIDSNKINKNVNSSSLSNKINEQISVSRSLRTNSPSYGIRSSSPQRNSTVTTTRSASQPDKTEQIDQLNNYNNLINSATNNINKIRPSTAPLKRNTYDDKTIQSSKKDKKHNNSNKTGFFSRFLNFSSSNSTVGNTVDNDTSDINFITPMKQRPPIVITNQIIDNNNSILKNKDIKLETNNIYRNNAVSSQIGSFNYVYNSKRPTSSTKRSQIAYPPVLIPPKLSSNNNNNNIYVDNNKNNSSSNSSSNSLKLYKDLLIAKESELAIMRQLLVQQDEEISNLNDKIGNNG
jgi:serine/threonine protein kinase